MQKLSIESFKLLFPRFFLSKAFFEKIELFFKVKKPKKKKSESQREQILFHNLSESLMKL